MTGYQPHPQDLTIPFFKEKDIEGKLTGSVVSLCTERLRKRVALPLFSEGMRTSVHKLNGVVYLLCFVRGRDCYSE